MNENERQYNVTFIQTDDNGSKTWHVIAKAKNPDDVCHALAMQAIAMVPRPDFKIVSIVEDLAEAM